MRATRSTKWMNGGLDTDECNCIDVILYIYIYIYVYICICMYSICVCPSVCFGFLKAILVLL